MHCTLWVCREGPENADPLWAAYLAVRQALVARMARAAGLKVGADGQESSRDLYVCGPPGQIADFMRTLRDNGLCDFTIDAPSEALAELEEVNRKLARPPFEVVEVDG
ncbi:MAG: hypothetical protein H5T97_14325 [Firmicutes bacterium]|nr:hypothetical protein [Bacillota bacterium]